jgi:hypothetical protein
VLFIREIDLEKSERILAILSDKEGSRIRILKIRPKPGFFTT